MAQTLQGDCENKTSSHLDVKHLEQCQNRGRCSVYERGCQEPGAGWLEKEGDTGRDCWARELRGRGAGELALGPQPRARNRRSLCPTQACPCPAHTPAPVSSLLPHQLPCTAASPSQGDHDHAWPRTQQPKSCQAGSTHICGQWS